MSIQRQNDITCQQCGKQQTAWPRLVLSAIVLVCALASCTDHYNEANRTIDDHVLACCKESRADTLMGRLERIDADTRDLDRSVILHALAGPSAQNTESVQQPEFNGNGTFNGAVGLHQDSLGADTVHLNVQGVVELTQHQGSAEQEQKSDNLEVFKKIFLPAFHYSMADTVIEDWTGLMFAGVLHRKYINEKKLEEDTVHIDLVRELGRLNDYQRLFGYVFGDHAYEEPLVERLRKNHVDSLITACWGDHQLWFDLRMPYASVFYEDLRIQLHTYVEVHEEERQVEYRQQIFLSKYQKR